MTTQQLDLYEGKQLLYKPQQAEGAWLEIPFEVQKKEPLRLLLNLTKSYDFGKYQASLNGVKLGGELDCTVPRSSTRSSTCSISGRSPEPTRCVWNARARTLRPRATTAAWNPCVSASAARA